VLANLGALHSKLAAQQHVFSEEGLKVAMKKCCEAAGYFGLVRDCGFGETGHYASALGRSINHALHYMMLGQVRTVLTDSTFTSILYVVRLWEFTTPHRTHRTLSFTLHKYIWLEPGVIVSSVFNINKQMVACL
jgi:hypothetical protein